MPSVQEGRSILSDSLPQPPTTLRQIANAVATFFLGISRWLFYTSLQPAIKYGYQWFDVGARTFLIFVLVSIFCLVQNWAAATSCRKLEREYERTVKLTVDRRTDQFVWPPAPVESDMASQEIAVRTPSLEIHCRLFMIKLLCWIMVLSPIGFVATIGSQLRFLEGLPILCLICWISMVLSAALTYKSAVVANSYRSALVTTQASSR